MKKLLRLKAGSNPARGSTTEPKTFFKTKIFNTLWELKKDGYAEQTIKFTGNRLKMLAKSVNLDEPEEIKEYLARKQGKNSYKEAIADAYARYVKYNGLTWKKPIYHRASQPPYVPTEEETIILISNSGKKYAMILSILRDTGMRPIELHRSTCIKLQRPMGLFIKNKIQRFLNPFKSNFRVSSLRS